MKLRTRILFGFIFILTSSVLILGLAGKLSGGQFSMLRFLGLVRETDVSSSDLLLTEIRSLRNLNTVEYVWKSVFPFDFLDENINFNSIMKTLRSGTGSVQTLLRPEEQEYLDTRNLAERIGFRIGGRSTDFVVVTASIRCGVDLSEIRLEVLQDVHRPGGGQVKVYPPSPRITDVVIEDPSDKNYPYPDVKLSPKNWKNLSIFIENRIRKEASKSGLLETADRNLKTFLTAFLSQIGYTRIEFPAQ